MAILAESVLNQWRMAGATLEELAHPTAAMLVKYGIWREPEEMIGIVFDYGGVDYIFDNEAAYALANGTARVKVWRLGRDLRTNFGHTELLRVLMRSDTLDQL